MDADARPERAPSQALGAKRLRLRLFTLPATIARTGRQVRLHLATKLLGPTGSTRAWAAYDPWPSLADAHPARPYNHHATPATWNRRPPETTLGPPSHPDDRINTSRHRTAATTLSSHVMKDPG